MELRISPSAFFSTEPFVVKINYHETLENLIYTISLTIQSAPVTEMELYFNGKRLRPLDMKISQTGLAFGDNIELRRSSGCCVIL